MLDIKFIRENKELIKENCQNRNAKCDIDKLLLLDDKRRELTKQLEDLRAEKNGLNELIQKASNEEREELIEIGKEIKEKSESIEPELKKVSEEFRVLMFEVPNVYSEDTPIGHDESGNKVIRKVGEIPKFDFTPKEHHEIGARLDLIDTERAGKVSGSRFAYLKGELVLLEFALMQFAFSVLTDEKQLEEIIKNNNLNIASKPFVPVIPPIMIRPEMMERMARLDPEEMYSLEKDKLNLIGSAEHTLGSMYADETLDANSLPIRMVGFSPAFRREAGSYGKDMKGILRMHQFNKLEMESFTLAEKSREEQDFIVAIQEYFMQALKIPYQVVAICTGDMGKPDIRQIDIESWMPGQNKYRETHTADLIGDFQARRLNTKVKLENGKLEYVHMNDATAFSQRPLIAILENYQQADGSVVIPEVLRKWMPGGIKNTYRRLIHS